MAILEEVETLDQVMLHVGQKTIDVRWTTSILRDGVEISKTYRRNAYGEENKAAFIADVENPEQYVAAIGWQV